MLQAAEPFHEEVLQASVFLHIGHLIADMNSHSVTAEVRK